MSIDKTIVGNFLLSDLKRTQNSIAETKQAISDMTFNLKQLQEALNSERAMEESISWALRELGFALPSIDDKAVA